MRVTRLGALALLPIADVSMADRDPIPASAVGCQFAQALPEIEAGTPALQRATAEFSSLATP
jgi:hypothetical protein